MCWRARFERRASLPAGLSIKNIMAYSIFTQARLLVAALVIALPASAFALTAADVAPLAGDDFDAKSAAIDKLIANHDAPSLAVLKALSEDSALATDAGAVLLQDGDTARDAVTGKTIAAGDAQPIT